MDGAGREAEVLRVPLHAGTSGDESTRGRSACATLGSGAAGRVRIVRWYPMSDPAKSPAASEPFSPLRWSGEALELLDQTRLPAEEVWLACREPAEVAGAIRRLAVRGAPAIGVAAAYGLALGLRGIEDAALLPPRFEEVSNLLAATRPTAVNLRWALARGREVFEEALAAEPGSAADVAASL